MCEQKQPHGADKCASYEERLPFDIKLVTKYEQQLLIKKKDRKCIDIIVASFFVSEAHLV
jgi:hypothetical protein